ncbi:MAG: NYN domain-containing protein [Leptolyngbyaceae cyanobacterium RM2_2_4]|nr:NYN domain-containing protein [Leptolyngbyaceae cyanobacterium SL_5_14]NJO48687.1 NYN domain-containing protein [Leptolyngbyaceae cyanobacterium RM2_2_4]
MPRPSTQAILLVDGYNIIGAWSTLQWVRDTEGLEAARRELAESLVGYSAFQGFDTQIIFDAQYQSNPASREVMTQNLSIFYTDPKQTADTYIEKTCAQFRNDLRKFQQRLIVATSDRAQQLTVVGFGAEWMSAQRLLADVELAALKVRRKQRGSKGRSPNRFLSSSLDPVAQQRLARMRLGLE